MLTQLQLQISCGVAALVPTRAWVTIARALHPSCCQRYASTWDVAAGRLTTHRRGGKIKGGASLEAAYVIVPESSDGQSAARMVEAQAIQVQLVPVSCRPPCRLSEGSLCPVARLLSPWCSFRVTQDSNPDMQ